MVERTDLPLRTYQYVASKKPAMETFWNDYGQNPLW